MYPQRPISHLWSILALVLLLLAGGMFLWRGVWRGYNADGSSDFEMLYAGTRAWLSGNNPYHKSELVRVMQAADPTGSAPARDLVSLYPPSLFVLLSPWGSLPTWASVKIAWLGFNLMLMPILMFSLLALGGLKIKSTSAMVLTGLVLAFAPLHTNFFLGQTTLAAVTLAACGAVLAERGKHPIWAGLLLGLAAALKLQLVGVFAVYQLLRRRWLCGMVALAIMGLTGVISLLPPAMHGWDWFAQLQANWAAFTQLGAEGDPGPTDPWRFSMIHLPVLFLTMISSRTTADWLSWGVFLLGGLVFLYLLYRQSLRACIKTCFTSPARQQGVGAKHRFSASVAGATPPPSWSGLAKPVTPPANCDELLELSILGLLTLLPVYHRTYDYLIVLLPLTWAIAHFYGPQRIFAHFMLVLCLFFFTPGGPMLDFLEKQHHLPGWLTGDWWWTVIFLPHQIWITLLMLAIFLERMWNRTVGQPSQTADP